MNSLQFWKYHGLGNDFIVVDARSGPAPVDANRARRLCDRHRGVGADGVLLARAPISSTNNIRMDIFNADGSIAEMCGNGLRCFALHAFDLMGFGGSELRVETAAGVHRCRLGSPASNTSSIGEVSLAVSMGPVRFGSPDLPITGAPAGPVAVPFCWRDGGTASGYPASMGNPHFVVFGNADVATALREGPHVQSLPLFPRGVNVGFAEVASPSHLKLTVFERGSGLTQACGTGACAAAAIARALGLADERTATRVSLPGGDLAIWQEPTSEADGTEIWMQGPAARVFSGKAPYIAA